MFKLFKKFFGLLRRMANSRIVKWVFVPLGVLLVLRGCVYEPYLTLNVERLTLPAKNWNPEIKNLKIAVVSDIHAGDRPLEKWRVQRIVNAINAESPDIVFLLGDFVNGFFKMTSMPPEELGKILKDIDAPLGKFAVTGNHDMGYGTRTLISGLEGSDIRFLNNESVRIETASGHFYVAGAAYRYNGLYNYKRTFSKVPEGEPTILLVHSPDSFPALPEQASIVFAGHTHGGQVRLPFYGALTKSHTVQVANKESGLMMSPRGIPMYVTPGVGTSFVTLRLFCPPQLEIITLEPTS